MKRKLDDYIGQKINCWTILKRINLHKFLCSCSCGRIGCLGEKEVHLLNILDGKSKSCGCHRGCGGKTRGGLTVLFKKEYKAWTDMIRHHKNIVCESWKASFQDFLEDVGSAPGVDYSLVRPDQSKEFSVENIMWVPRADAPRYIRKNLKKVEVEGRNVPLIDLVPPEKVARICSRLNRGWSAADALEKPLWSRINGVKLEHNGESLSIPQWAARLGIKEHTLRYRLSRGWTIDEMLNPPEPPQPNQGEGKIDCNGQSLTLAEWSEKTGLDEKVIRHRLGKGWSIADALSRPKWCRSYLQ